MIEEQEKRIKELEDHLSKSEPLFRVGDIVYCFLSGEVTEVSSDDENNYPVSVLFEDGSENTFTVDGCAQIGDRRTLYFEEIPVPKYAKKEEINGKKQDLQMGTR
jgi:hypothetical protein